MPRDYLTDIAILKTIVEANVIGNDILEAGRAVYLGMPHAERCVLNGSIRKLEEIRGMGIVMALEVLTAVGMKEAQHAND